MKALKKGTSKQANLKNNFCKNLQNNVINKAAAAKLVGGLVYKVDRWGHVIVDQ